MKGVRFLEGRFGYKDFPKVACTSIKTTLYELENGMEFSLKTEGGHIHEYYNRNKEDIGGCERRFTVVRDPIKRFLSAYGNRVEHHGELSEWYIANSFPGLYDRIPIFNPGIGQFIDCFDVYRKVTSINHHVRPIGDFLAGNSLDFFTDVYKIEDISNFQSELSELYRKNAAFGREQSGGRKVPLKDLSKKQMDYLIEYYREDYRLLEKYYSLDDIWKEWKGVRVCSNKPSVRPVKYRLNNRKISLLHDPRVCHVSLWKAVPVENTDSVTLHGLFLADKNYELFFNVNGEKVFVRSGLPSPNFSKKSKINGSERARFVSEAYSYSGVVELWAENESEEFKVLTIG